MDEIDYSWNFDPDPKKRQKQNPFPTFGLGLLPSGYSPLENKMRGFRSGYSDIFVPNKYDDKLISTVNYNDEIEKNSAIRWDELQKFADELRGRPKKESATPESDGTFDFNINIPESQNEFKPLFGDPETRRNNRINNLQNRIDKNIQKTYDKINKVQDVEKAAQIRAKMEAKTDRLKDKLGDTVKGNAGTQVDWASGAVTAAMAAPGLISNFTNDPTSKEEYDANRLSTTMTAAQIGGSFVPIVGHLAGAAAGFIASTLRHKDWKEDVVKENDKQTLAELNREKADRLMNWYQSSTLKDLETEQTLLAKSNNLLT
jgi:hypothetical protein